MGFYGRNSLCKNITNDTVQDYITYLRTKPKKQNNPNSKKETEFLSSVTIATYIRNLRAVLNVFMGMGYVKRFIVKVPKFDREIPEVYLEEELHKLLKKPNIKTCSFSEYRNWVMTNYLLGTANRISTARNIQIKDLNFNECEIYLRKVKNRKPYTIPMQQSLRKVLIEYLNYRGGEPEDYLFCSENDDKKQLSCSTIKTAVSRYNKNRGVLKTSAHLYRNTFAKFWILKGGDLVRLKTILGHSSLDMVLEYVEMYGSDLQQNFDDFNPLAAYAKGNSLKIRKNKVPV